MKQLIIILIALCLVPLSVPAQTRPPGASEGGGNLPTQKIGPSDLVGVAVYNAPELTRTVRVGADGFIRLPMLKQRIKTEGLMPADLEAAIAQALKSEQLIMDPIVTVTMAEYHSHPISIMGAVKRPITFQADGPTTLLEALSRAEGLSPDAGAEILVTSTQPGANGAPTSLTQRVSVRDLIDAADPDANVKLSGGEEIRVPEVGKIFVVGNVKKPGAYSVRDGLETSVLKALALSEGLMPFAGKQAYIYRREAVTGSKNELPIELTKIMSRKAPDVTMMANDILYVPDRSSKRVGLATLEKIIMFGSGASSALIYGAVVH